VLDTLIRDVRYALRVLRRSPAFTATAIVTLALVIGGNTAVASLADAVLLRPLPYPEPNRLGVVTTNRRAADGGQGTQGSQDGESWETLRDRAESVDVALSAGGFGGGVNMVIGETAAIVNQMRVSAGYFRVLGVAPLIGREFAPEEDRPAGPAVAVISHRLWQRELRGDPDVLGKTMLLRGEPHIVVGVMPQAFEMPGDPEVWTPVRPSRTGEGVGTNYRIIARIVPGRTLQEATAELENLGRAAFAARGRLAPGASAWWSFVPMQEVLTAEARQPIELLAGAMGMVLLIACVNVAALLLARGRTRSREIATRMAIGSGRGAVVRQLLVESVILGAVGGAAGALVGYVALDALRTLSSDTSWDWSQATLDARVLVATAGLALLTSLIFGLAPALQASRLDVNAALAGSGSRGIAGGSAHWTRRGLVETEVALGVVLLVLTGLLIQTFVNLRSMDPGFDASGVTTATVSLQDARYDTAARVNQLFDTSLEALAHTPGVLSAAVSLELPYRRLLNYNFKFVGDPIPDARITNVMYVTPRFFETLKIPLRGRDFEPGDRAGAAPVAIVNETFVRSWGNGLDTIGRRLSLMDEFQREIVGVAGDVLVTNAGIGFPGAVPGPLMTSPIIFIPAAQTPEGFMRLIHTWFQPIWSVRTTGGVNVTRVLPQAIGQADPLLPVQDVQPLSTVQASATAEQRLLMTLVGVIAATALLLAAIGIYGLIAHGIAERTRELGVRLALGATPVGTMLGIVRAGVVVAGVGVAIGAGLAWMAVAVFDSFAFLFRVDKHDPLTFAGAAMFLLVMASIASVLPALRVLRLDPAKVLRE
jgi:predicted permease